MKEVVGELKEFPDAPRCSGGRDKITEESKIATEKSRHFVHHLTLILRFDYREDNVQEFANEISKKNQ